MAPSKVPAVTWSKTAWTSQEPGGLDGAEAILKLRALISNGDFDQYWRFRLRKEHEHIHHARYRESYLLAA